MASINVLSNTQTSAPSGGQQSRVIDGILEVWGRVISTIDGAETITFDTSAGVFAAAPVVTSSLERTGTSASYGSITNIIVASFDFNRVDTVGNADNPFVHFHAIGPVA